jgi:hypothetical protein
MKLFSRPNKPNSSNQPIIIVSGLPRSGTSMMMRMLAEGGLPILTDELRPPDDDNPNGYFELEVVRQIKEGNVAWLNDANGKVVKVVSALLEYLPKDYQYKIIFMERDPKETLASQKKMLDHRKQEARLSDEEMEQQFHKHLAAMKPWLVRQPNMDVLYVNYNALMAEPKAYCDRITEFLGISLNQTQMLAVPNTQLYRNRAVTEK